MGSFKFLASLKDFLKPLVSFSQIAANSSSNIVWDDIQNANTLIREALPLHL